MTGRLQDGPLLVLTYFRVKQPPVKPNFCSGHLCSGPHVTPFITIVGAHLVPTFTMNQPASCRWVAYSSPIFGAYLTKESVDLTGLSDANAYNWNGFTAGLQVSMSSSEGEGESSLARTETDIFSDEPGKEKKRPYSSNSIFIPRCSILWPIYRHFG